MLFAITGDHSAYVRDVAFEESVSLAIKSSKEEIRKGFSRLAISSHQTLVKAYLNAIPLPWFRGQLSGDARSMFEGTYVHERAWLNFSSGKMEISVDAVEDDANDAFGIPIGPIFQGELTDKEKRRLIRDVVFPPPTEREIAEIVSRGQTIRKEDGDYVSNQSAFLC